MRRCRCRFLRTKAARKDGLPIAAQPETLAISSTQRSREIAFVAMLAPPLCFLVSVKIRNLHTRSTQREQIRDLNIATDTKPAQLGLSQ